MSDQYREVATMSWGKRIAHSLTTVLLGILLASISFYLVWWNEGRSIDRTKTLSEGRDMVVEISADTIDPSNDGALVHLSGKTVTNDVLNDSVFGVEVVALKLRRSVQMYQWKERRDTKIRTTIGGDEIEETVYTYRKVWSENLIDSSRFRRSRNHQNPSSMPYEGLTLSASNAKIGNTDLGRIPLGQTNQAQLKAAASFLEDPNPCFGPIAASGVTLAFEFQRQHSAFSNVKVGNSTRNI